MKDSKKEQNSETKRAREAEHNKKKNNGFQERKANTKLVGGRAIERGLVGEKTKN